MVDDQIEDRDDEKADDAVDGQLPLSGIRVLDLTRVLAGPMATCVLGDLGADIVKVEEPDGDHVRTLPPFYAGDQSHYFLAINRNKRSIVVDVKSAEGRDLILDLAAKSDVVVENFRPGVMQRLGLGFDVLSAGKSDVILCSISGFGRSGPLRDQPSFDLVSQARSGVMSITGEPDGPPTKLGLPLGDLGGGLWAAIAILAALHRRDRDGTAQHIDLSLLDGLVGLLGYLGQLALMTGQSPGRVGSGHHHIVPYGRFETADGHMVLALHVGAFWRRFCVAVERPDLIIDARFHDTSARRDNRAELQLIVEEILRARTRAEWEILFTEADLPHGPVLDVAEALHQEHLTARDSIMTVAHKSAGDIPMVRPPIRFVGEPPPQARRAAPLLGEHTAEICRELLGLDDATIEGLHRGGVVYDPGQADPGQAAPEHHRTGHHTAADNEEQP